MRSRDISAEVCALAAISTWEAAALLTGLIPTVTSMVMRLPTPARRLVVAAAACWLAGHFDVRGRR